MPPERRGPLPHPRSVVRGAAFATYAGAMLAAWEVHHRALPHHRLEEWKRRYKRRVATDLLRILGAEWRILGLGELAPGPRLVVSNHRSALDIGVLLACFTGSHLSRADVADWPLLGKLATHGETIYVDRQKRSSGARALREIRRALIEGRTVVVFPEGTTTSGDVVRPFQAGAFVAAKGLDVEILPVGLAYDGVAEWDGGTFLEHLGHLSRLEGVRVTGKVGTPRRASDDPRAMAATLEGDVQALVNEARAAHRSS